MRRRKRKRALTVGESRGSLRSWGSARKRSGARPRALKARLWVHAVKVRRKHKYIKIRSLELVLPLGNFCIVYQNGCNPFIY